ncbi:MAG: hypothetical protein JJU29_12760 [Verrucomicrobia bacterium]|nr:hypothetical protein [Verrucomicrobiota bacterium]MCH8512632.1 hypothetical protein [Kiritimatiellia bacterium]
MMKHKVPITRQTDNHTCGYCAACSAYRYYGLDPAALELRTYLGTDNILPYNVPFRDKIEAWMGGTDHALSGTSPMDLMAELYWDGFDVETATVGYARYRDWLHDHLRNGDLALSLMYSCLHWVVVCGMDAQGVWITDGYFTDSDFNGGGSRAHTYRLSHERFAEEEHGTFLISRDDDDGDFLVRQMTNRDFIREYARGLSFIGEALGKNIPRVIRKRYALITGG